MPISKIKDLDRDWESRNKNGVCQGKDTCGGWGERHREIEHAGGCGSVE